MARADVLSALAVELQAYRRARRSGDIDRQWTALERAHVLSQRLPLEHLRTHARMLGLAIRSRDGSEIFGQIMRLGLAPLGNLTGRVPIGNSGRANVSAFLPMRVPEDLRDLVS